MNILVCSDGTAESENAITLGRQIARAAVAKVTLLGIAEDPAHEQPLRQALERQSLDLNAAGLQMVVRSGEPISQIIVQTRTEKFDLVIVGSRRKEATGPFWRSFRTYEIVRAIEPPVLIALGRCDRLNQFLVCTGGKRYIDDAVRLTGALASVLKASVTLLHVMAEPPAIYADLVQMEENVEALLNSRSELGRNLAGEKQALDKLGVPAQVRVRHGFVLDQLFQEVNQGNYDMIVTGSSRGRGALRHYIMGDITREIVNRAECPVLIARSTAAPSSLLTRWRKKVLG